MMSKEMSTFSTFFLAKSPEVSAAAEEKASSLLPICLLFLFPNLRLSLSSQPANCLVLW